MDTFVAVEKEFLSAVNSISHITKVLIAVSGGADSMAMLALCIKFFPSLGIPFSVITINHNIRSEKDSASDALFVSSFCTCRGIPCIQKNIEKGMVKKLADARQKGTEEAARVIRYSLFESTAVEVGASHIFLGHTKNDQVETLVQRFFQGSASSLYGIVRERKPYFRPLLGVERKDIETYLSAQGISYCTDATNFDNAYLRNRLRNEVIPYVSKTVPGWQTGILCGAKKAYYDADFINTHMQDIWKKEDSQTLFTDASLFLSFHMALRIRYLYISLTQLQIDQRIPFSIIERAARGERCETGSVMFYQKKGKLCAKKLSSTGKLQHFFAIIEKECVIALGGGTLLTASELPAFMMNTKHTRLCTSLPCMAVIQNDTVTVEQLSADSPDKLVYVAFIRNNDE